LRRDKSSKKLSRQDWLSTSLSQTNHELSSLEDCHLKSMKTKLLDFSAK
jgi:hypothetical protein